MFRFSVSSFCLLVIFLTLAPGHAQSTDILRVEYLRIPENDTGIETSRYRFALNLPIKVGWDKYLVAGAEYNRLDVGFSQTLPFDSSELNRLHIVDLNVGYITKWNDNWRVIGIITPRFASNFTDGVVTEDFFFNAIATFLKEKSDVPKPFRIVLGLSYNSTTGFPVPLPLVSYYKRFHPKWSYTIGRDFDRFRPKNDCNSSVKSKVSVKIARTSIIDGDRMFDLNQSIYWKPKSTGEGRSLENTLHEDSGNMDFIGVQTTGWQQLLDLSDRDSGRTAHTGVEITGRALKDQVARLIALPGFYKGEIGLERGFQNMHFAIEFTGLLAFGDFGTITRRGIKCRETGLGGPALFSQGALRGQFDLQFTAEHLTFELIVLAHIRRYHFFDLTLLQQQSQAEIVDPRIVRDTGQVGDAQTHQFGNGIFRDTAETEAPEHERHVVFDPMDGRTDIGYFFIDHRFLVMMTIPLKI